MREQMQTQENSVLRRARRVAFLLLGQKALIDLLSVEAICNCVWDLKPPDRCPTPRPFPGHRSPCPPAFGTPVGAMVERAQALGSFRHGDGCCAEQLGPWPSFTSEPHLPLQKKEAHPFCQDGLLRF